LAVTLILRSAVAVASGAGRSSVGAGVVGRRLGVCPGEAPAEVVPPVVVGLPEGEGVADGVQETRARAVATAANPSRAVRRPEGVLDGVG